MFAAKLAAGTRKAKKINTKAVASTRTAKRVTTKSTKSAASKRTTEKVISKVIPKSTLLTELANQQDLLNPVDLEFFWKKNYLVRIWPD